MRWIVCYLAAFASLGGAATARAQDFPPRKPGLWQIDISVPAAPGPPAGCFAARARLEVEIGAAALSAQAPRAARTHPLYRRSLIR